MHRQRIAIGLISHVLLAPFGFGAPQSPELAVPDRAPPAGIGADDWSGIRAAFEGERHKLRRVPEGHRASNPGQRWSTVFDGRGFTTRPDAGSWSWGLELVRYGFAGQEREVSRPECTRIVGREVTYGWDDVVQEWYVNDARGLEHGYTVLERLGADADAEPRPLQFTIAVRGGLDASVRAGGRDVDFVDDAGATVVTYSGLAVLDAEGRSLPARFDRVGDHLLLSVQESGARYPITIDPVAQQAYLKASNTGPSDWFGTSVSRSGDTVVVGAMIEASNAKGVNGDQSDNSATQAGAAYVFVRNGSTWSQQAYLKASNTESYELFGVSVSVSGDTVVVGAAEEDSDATGVNGDQTNNSAPAAGAAYVFVRSGTTWSQQAYVKASNTDSGDQFGTSVSLCGNTLVVGAHTEDSDATGVNGDQTSNGGHNSGAAYMFVRSGTVWSQQAYLKASNTDPQDLFGRRVALCGETVAVGASWEASSATGVNGDAADNSAGLAGAAYVFVRSGTSWRQEAYLKASNTDPFDHFGVAVAVSGDTVVVGAPSEASRASGINGNQQSNNAIGSGAAYVFVRAGTTWSQQAYLKASNTGLGDSFGSAVSVFGDTVAVGAYGEDSRATGVNGDQSSNRARASGAVYVFGRSETIWRQRAYLKASNTGADDQFGSAVAVSGSLLLASSPFEDSDATGVNGGQHNDRTLRSGAAYVFDLLRPTLYCTAKAGLLCGAPRLGFSGASSASATSGFDLHALPARANRTALFLYSNQGRANSPFHGGTLCLASPIFTSVLARSGGIGACDGAFAIDWNRFAHGLLGGTPQGFLLIPGELVNVQVWGRDSVATGSYLSDAIEYCVGP